MSETALDRVLSSNDKNYTDFKTLLEGGYKFSIFLLGNRSVTFNQEPQKNLSFSKIDEAFNQLNDIGYTHPANLSFSDRKTGWIEIPKLWEKFQKDAESSLISPNIITKIIYLAKKVLFHTPLPFIHYLPFSGLNYPIPTYPPCVFYTAHEFKWATNIQTFDELIAFKKINTGCSRQGRPLSGCTSVKDPVCPDHPHRDPEYFHSFFEYLCVDEPVLYYNMNAFEKGLKDAFSHLPKNTYILDSISPVSSM